MPPPTEANRFGRSTPVARPAVIDDTAAMARINVTGWQYAYRDLVPASYLDAMDQPAMRERWAARLTNSETRQAMFVAEIDGEVVAYASAGEYRTQQDADPGDQTNRWGELYAIYADPGRQARGAGSAVHQAALNHLTSTRFQTAALWVLRGNVRAIGWYERRGWRADGATSVWSGAGVPLPEIRLVRDLG